MLVMQALGATGVVQYTEPAAGGSKRWQCENFKPNAAQALYALNAAVFYTKEISYPNNESRE